MTDAELDQKLRAMSVELAESSPIAPNYEELHERAGIAVTQVEITPVPHQDDRSRRPGIWQKTLGVLGLGVVVGGGAFAFAALTENDGADTPQAAVEEFIEAAAAEDAIGVAETLVASERDLVLDYLDPILAELQRLDIAGDAVDTRDVGGLDVTADVDSLAVQESPMTDTVTRVRIVDGDLGLDADFDAMPVGSAVRDEGPLADPDPVDVLVDIFGGQADVMTVEDGEGWHVSIFYTLAEYLRSDAGLPSGGVGDGPEPVGAESPEALMAAVVDGATAGDFARLLTLADPVDGAVLYDYWPVFEPQWSDGLTRALADGPHAEVQSYETAVAGDGAERVISLTSWDYSYSIAGPWDIHGTSGETAVTWDGRCFTTTPSWTTDVEGFTPPPGEGCLGDTTEFEGLTLSTQRSGLVDLAVVERDGRWYVRPGATLIENWLEANGQVEASEAIYPFSLVWGAYPAPPTWGFGAGLPLVGTARNAESSEEGERGVLVPNCDSSLDDAAMAACLSELYGQVSADDVSACRLTLVEAPVDDDLEASWELEGCILEVLYPPTPMDLFLQELATCPGGGSSDAAEATPEEQEALIECGRAIFESGEVPEEILTGLATCLGVEPDALASVTDNQALITCAVEAIAGPPPVQEDSVDEEASVGEITEESATPLPVPTSIVVGEG